MGSSQKRRHVIDILFILALFSVFTAASLVVVFIGADVYSRTVRQSDINFEVNTTLTFLTTTIRQHDAQGAVRLDYIGSSPALVLSQTIYDIELETWIHHYDGVLREISINSESRHILFEGIGQALIDVYDFGFNMADEGLIEITAISAAGSVGRTLVALRSR